MTKRIEVDAGLCESNAIGMGINSDIFVLDELDDLHVMSAEVTAENEHDVAEAIRQCPRQAIRVATD